MTAVYLSTYLARYHSYSMEVSWLVRAVVVTIIAIIQDIVALLQLYCFTGDSVVKMGSLFKIS